MKKRDIFYLLAPFLTGLFHRNFISPMIYKASDKGRHSTVAALATPSAGVLLNFPAFAMTWRALVVAAEAKSEKQTAVLGLVAYLLSFLGYGVGVVLGIGLGIGPKN